MNPQALFILGAFVVSAVSMPVCIWWAHRLGIVDRPTHRKIHVKPIPYLGGLGLLAGFVIAPLAGFYFTATLSGPVYFNRMLLLLAPSIAAGLLGLIDDKFQIRARVKLLSQIAIILLFSYFCCHISLVFIPGWGIEDLNDLGIPLTIAWMLGVVNGVNLIDGVDGLAASVTTVIYAAIAFLAASIKDQSGMPDPDWAVLAVALAGCGATLGFLAFNWRPAKIYMGDAGSLASGTLIAVLLVALGHKMRVFKSESELNALIQEPFPYNFAIITLVVFYPLLEISLSIIRRLLAGKPIGSADQGHIHHRLLKAGWSAPQICATAAVFSLLTFGIVAAVRAHYHGVAVWLLLSLGILFVLLMHFCGFLEMLHPRSIKGNRPHFLIANHFTSMQLIKLDLAQSVGEVTALAAQTSIEFGVERFRLNIPEKGDLPETQHEWVKPASVHGSLLLTAGTDAGNAGVLQIFSDKVEFPEGASATWTFEPHVVEDEIDVEYRVLVSEFMRKALSRAETLSASAKGPSGPHRKSEEPATGVSSTVLRRRGTQRISNKLPAAQMPEKKEL